MLKEAKARVSTALSEGNLKSAYKNETGAAISLSEMMIAVVVSAILIGGVIAVLVNVIPWAQDEAAKSQLTSIITAQDTYFTAQAAIDGSSVSYAGGLEGVDIITSTTLGNLFDGSSLENFRIYSNGTGTSGSEWLAIYKSGSGSWFGVSNDKQTPTALTDAAVATAVTTVLDGDVTDYEIADAAAFDVLHDLLD